MSVQANDLRRESGGRNGGGSGIGAAAAERLAREGARVVLAGRRLASLERVANVTRRAGGTAIVKAAGPYESPRR
jgi:NAD(P)-dependent dehydrogenase (short-subunit alcohol dehydrogenase family)